MTLDYNFGLILNVGRNKEIFDIKSERGKNNWWSKTNIILLFSYIEIIRIKIFKNYFFVIVIL